MAWCNPIGNLRRVSLCTRRYHGTRSRCHGYTTNVRAHRLNASRVNALPATRATHRALIRPRLWPYSFAKCHARVGKIERTTGCRVVFALPFFFFSIGCSSYTIFFSSSADSRLKRFRKPEEFFSRKTGGFLSFADIFLPSPPDFNNKQRPQRETKVSSRSFPSNMALTHDSLDERPFRSPLSSKK